MARFDSGNRLLSRANALKEVAHVIVARIKAVGAFREWRIDQRLVAGSQVPAVHPDPARGALEANPVALARGVLDATENTVGFRGAHIVDNAVRVSELHVVFADGGVSTGDRLGESFSFNLRGS